MQFHDRIVLSFQTLNREDLSMGIRRIMFSPPVVASASAIQNVVDLAWGERWSELLAYRSWFQEYDNSKRESHLGSTINRYLDDWKEDENCNPMALDEFRRIVCQVPEGQDFVVRGDVGSLLRIGPSGIRESEELTESDANDFLHFIQTMSLLGASSWAREEIVMHMTTTSADVDAIEVPSFQDALGVLLLVRQFVTNRDHGKMTVAKKYAQIVDHELKRLWLEDCIASFFTQCESDMRMGNSDSLRGISRKQLIDRVTYGTGLVHLAANQHEEKKLTELYEKVGGRQLLLSFHEDCHSLLCPLFALAAAMQMDFGYWVRNGICPQPTRTLATTFFENLPGVEKKEGNFSGR